ncbi:hypothetical protein CWI36_2967p0010 [Hamiltosporidium magnivora]|uniref:Uncharacterized protein n=1 Tax=Hamiltosporidium magnivora TaxID=148818 RepID=A0A4V2JTT1_9MICR|nr:hypothetical protein CWI36_2967p0010 [Hamiltosporidium magnivora]
MECGRVRCDSREGGVNDRDRLEGVNDRDRLEGVSNSNRLEGVSNTNRLEGVNYSTNTLHPVNTNTTSFTLRNSFVFGDCKLSKILKYFKRVWNVDISMVTIRDTVVFCTFYDNERFKNNLEKFISELCHEKEGDGIIYCEGGNIKIGIRVLDIGEGI